MKKEKNCENCKYWERWDAPKESDDYRFGNCHKNPPQVHTEFHNIGSFPRTTKDVWCGEFKPKKNEKRNN